jgi:hypothetical protein
MIKDCSAVESTYINEMDRINQSLLNSHSILDNLMGTEPAEKGDEWKEPDYILAKVHQILTINVNLADRLNARLQTLISKF